MALPATGGGVSVSLDDASVEAMLARVVLATSPESFAAFLEDEVQPHFHDAASDRFAQEGSSKGPWAELTPATQRRRAQLGFSPAHPINRRSGDLEEYVTKTAGVIDAAPDVTSWTWPTPPSDEEMASKLATAQGRSRGAPGTPARPVLEAGPTDLADILALLETDLLVAMGGGFL